MSVHTCPRRDDMVPLGFPSRGKANEDGWRGPDRNNVRTCTYCGSLHPDDFMRLALEKVELGPTDKGYKVYVDVPESQPQELRVISAITHDSKGSITERWEPADLEIIKQDGWSGADYKWMLRKPRGPKAFGKFYFQHLSIEQRIAFVDLLNTEALNIGYPGYFYRLPFFCVKGK